MKAVQTWSYKAMVGAGAGSKTRRQSWRGSRNTYFRPRNTVGIYNKTEAMFMTGPGTWTGIYSKDMVLILIGSNDAVLAVLVPQHCLLASTYYVVLFVPIFSSPSVQNFLELILLTFPSCRLCAQYFFVFLFNYFAQNLFIHLSNFLHIFNC